MKQPENNDIVSIFFLYDKFDSTVRVSYTRKSVEDAVENLKEYDGITGEVLGQKKIKFSSFKMIRNLMMNKYNSNTIVIPINSVYEFIKTANRIRGIVNLLWLGNNRPEDRKYKQRQENRENKQRPIVRKTSEADRQKAMDRVMDKVQSGKKDTESIISKNKVETINDINIVENVNERYISSLQIAKLLGIEHKSLKEKIKEEANRYAEISAHLEQTPSFRAVPKYLKQSYIDARGRKQEHLALNETMYQAVVLGYSTPKASKFKYLLLNKLTNLARFANMVKFLDEQTYKEASNVSDSAYNEIMNELEEERQENKLLSEEVNEQRKMLQLEDIKTADGSITIEALAKVMNSIHNIDIGRSRLFRMLKDKKFLTNKNLPYQVYLGSVFKLFEYTTTTGSIRTIVVVTKLGQERILALYNR